MAKVALVRDDLEWLLQQVEIATGQRPVEVPGDKRDARRYKWLTAGTVTFVDYKDYSEPLCITTYTISVNGLDFRSPRMLEPGCKILLTLETDEGQLRIPATVVHSTPSIGLPTVGVSFDLD